MMRLIIWGGLLIWLVGCQAATAVSPPTSTPIPTNTPFASFDPTDPEVVFGDGLETSPLFQLVQPETLISVASLADLTGNIAEGDAAPDFEARLMGDEIFVLSENQDAPLLIIPTALGCAECVANLRSLAEVYPEFRGRGLQVLVLDIILGDEPEVWQRFADYLNEPDILWGVIISPQFAMDYDILSLGTVLLIDGNGRIAFRNENPMTADGFRQLMELATVSSATAAPMPTATAVPPTITPTPEPVGFTAVPGNIATGKLAPDFAIHTLGDETMNLSDWRGQYILLLPTTPGCGECMLHINMLEAVYPDFRGQGIQVVLLDLTPENNPGYWEFLANNINEPEYVWGTATSTDFVLNYEIKTLGTILLIDPDGRIVYRSEKVQPSAVYRQLFELASS